LFNKSTVFRQIPLCIRLTSAKQSYMQMTKKADTANGKYPMVGLRLSKAVSGRAKKLARLKTKGAGRRVTMSDVIRICIEQYLPVLEKKAAEVAAKAVGK
jgi:hypothetical protein